jgi:nitroreductase
MYGLDETIRNRRSTRLFLRNKPVPRELVLEALGLATRAPSNSNIQPWRLVFNSGPARDRLVKALLNQADDGDPKVPAVPGEFHHFRSDLGALVYGSMGVPRNDPEASRVAVLRNWEFFRAPLRTRCTRRAVRSRTTSPSSTLSCRFSNSVSCGEALISAVSCCLTK